MIDVSDKNIFTKYGVFIDNNRSHSHMSNFNRTGYKSDDENANLKNIHTKNEHTCYIEMPTIVDKMNNKYNISQNTHVISNGTPSELTETENEALMLHKNINNTVVEHSKNKVYTDNKDKHSRKLQSDVYDEIKKLNKQIKLIKYEINNIYSSYNRIISQRTELFEMTNNRIFSIQQDIKKINETINNYIQ